MAERYKKAIASIESGGKYNKLGPVTKDGDQAHGKYQVMGKNIPAWTKQVFGKAMTPKEFLNNPEAQDRVFEVKFGELVKKHGEVGAAKAWFAGEKGMKNPNARDILGTTVDKYGKKFSKALGNDTEQKILKDAGINDEPVAKKVAQVEQPAQKAPVDRDAIINQAYGNIRQAGMAPKIKPRAYSDFVADEKIKPTPYGGTPEGQKANPNKIDKTGRSYEDFVRDEKTQRTPYGGTPAGQKVRDQQGIQPMDEDTLLREIEKATGVTRDGKLADEAGGNKQAAGIIGATAAAGAGTYGVMSGGSDKPAADPALDEVKKQVEVPQGTSVPSWMQGIVDHPSVPSVTSAAVETIASDPVAAQAADTVVRKTVGRVAQKDATQNQKSVAQQILEQSIPFEEAEAMQRRAVGMDNAGASIFQRPNAQQSVVPPMQTAQQPAAVQPLDLTQYIMHGAWNT